MIFRLFNFIKRPITSAGFARLGIGRLPSYDLIHSQPKAEENQWIIRLGGNVPAFLRIQYFVQPIAEDRQDPLKKPYVWGKVHPKGVEYLIQVATGAFVVIAEFNSITELPDSLRNLEETHRPTFEALGWTREDLVAWLDDGSE